MIRLSDLSDLSAKMDLLEPDRQDMLNIDEKPDDLSFLIRSFALSAACERIAQTSGDSWQELYGTVVKLAVDFVRSSSNGTLANYVSTLPDPGSSSQRRINDDFWMA